MCNVNFLIADMIKFSSDTKITFSQGVEQKSNLSSFQSLVPDYDGQYRPSFAGKTLLVSYPRTHKRSLGEK